MRRLLSAVVIASVILTGCDSSGPSVSPPAQIIMSALPESAQAGSTVTGIRATVRDRDGDPVPGATVEWVPEAGSASPATGTTNDAGVVITAWTVGTSTGTQALRARVNTLEAVRTLSVMPGDLARLELEPDSITLLSVGDSAALSVQGTDAHGNPVPFPTVSWSYSTPGIARVRANKVVAQAEGVTILTAQAGDVSGTVRVVVAPELAGLRLDPDLSALVLDETIQLTALGVDARGNAITGPLEASWSSSDEQIASVDDQDGTVTGRAEGTVTISAHANGMTAELTIQVRPGTRPTITGITPAALAPGDTATITGTGFSATVGENQVSLSGHQVQVLSAGATELRVVMPASGVLPCTPTTDRDVVVTVDGLSAFARHPIGGARRLELGAGESVALLGSQVACNELAAGGSYKVSVFNTSPTATARTGFLLSGTAQAEAAPMPRIARHVHITAPVLDPEPEDVAHHWILEQNNRTLQELARRTGRQPPRAPEPFALESASVGDTRTFRIPDLDADNLCNSFHTVTARAVFVGSNAVIWEDQAAPLAGQMDSRWTQTGQEYESVMHPIIRDYFGDPRTYDSWLSGNGRVNMLFSQRVNNFQRGVNGFVFSGDFFPVGQCSQSNNTTVFYGRVPTVAGSGYEGNTAAAWAWSMRATIIHEVKHLVSYAVKLRLWQEAGAAGSPNYEVIWLEEATARLAEEFYARAVSGYGQGDNVTYQQSIWCERRVGTNWPQCDPIPNMVYKHFAGVYQYFKDVESLSPVGPVSQQDATFYGSGWLLVRWAMDQSTLTEQAFSRALVDEPALTSVGNLAARAGRTFPELLADFSLAMMMDDHPSGVQTRPQLRIPSWDTRDIMKGMYEDHQNTDLANVYDRPWPLGHRDQSFGNFDTGVDGIQGGTATFFRLTGPSGQRQLLELLSPAGATAASNLGVAIVRIQ